MFRLRRWWLLCGAVLVGVVALNGVVNGVVDAKAAPAPRAVWVRGGATATDGVSGRGLVCVQTKVRGLRWRFQPIAVTTTTTTTSPSTTTTTTVAGVVAPVLVSVSASDGVRVTVAGMRPDTGVYSLQWVPYGQSFNTYQMARATSPSMSVPAGWFVCNRTYTFRVFVMQAGWQLADGHQTQNVTHHSTPFDVVMPACPAPATPVTCATGGACVVGDTGPGGGIVFYVSATNFTSTGSDCNITCKYLEAAPTNWLTDTIGDPRRSWVTNVLSNRSSLVVGADGTAIGSGYQNSLDIVAQTGNVADSSAAVFARAYQGNSKTDWYLPSKDELNELCKYAKNTGQAVGGAIRCIGGSDATLRGFTADGYWSSSEIDSTRALGQLFSGGDHGNVTKDFALLMRPVRAFG